jgi:hypothetical protein
MKTYDEFQKEMADKVVYYDYTNQAWVIDGVYDSCNHPAAMNCDCYGRLHAGEPAESMVA